MKQSDRQVGGLHYKSEYQHWDWAIDLQLGYLESAATKYITRWRGKNGVQDVEKALHYIQKAEEAFLEDRYKNNCLNSWNSTNPELGASLTRQFLLSNNIVGAEAEFMWHSSSWVNQFNFPHILDLGREILSQAQSVQEQRCGTLPKGGSIAAKNTPGQALSQPEDNTGQNHPFGYSAKEEGIG